MFWYVLAGKEQAYCTDVLYHSPMHLIGMPSPKLLRLQIESPGLAELPKSRLSDGHNIFGGFVVAIPLITDKHPNASAYSNI